MLFHTYVKINNFIIKRNSDGRTTIQPNRYLKIEDKLKLFSCSLYFSDT